MNRSKFLFIFISLLITALCLWATLNLAHARPIGVVTKEGENIPLYKDYQALVIGVGDYIHWPKLSNAVKDAEDVAKQLKALGFQVKLLRNPTSSEFQNQMQSLPYDLGSVPERALLIYFAGHGATENLADETKLGYVIPKDCPLPNRDPMGFATLGISMKQIETLALRLRSRHVLMVFDSCFSGSLFSMVKAAPVDITEKVARPVRQFITAGTEEEEVPDQSTFKKVFLDGLKGEADYDKDGYVTGTELGMYLQKEVVNYTRGGQHPQYGKIRNPGLDKGDFVFVLPQRQMASLTVQRQEEARKLEEERKSLANERAQIEAEWKRLEDQQKLEEERRKFAEEKVKLEARKKEETNKRKIAEDQRRLEAQQAQMEKEKIQLEEQKKLEAERQALGEKKKQLKEEQKAEAEKKVKKQDELIAMAPRPSQIPSKVDSSLSSYKEPVADMEFVLVKGGCYRMGNAPGTWGDGDPDEKSIHEVCVDDFYLGKYEVTQGQWKSFMGNNPSYFKNGDDFPVESISWNDVQKFIFKLNKKSGKKYRLPTEAEWEYAARSGGKKEKWAGISNEYLQGEWEVAWYYFNSGNRTNPVGQKRPNSLGLYDMSGNVWEWVQDVYNSWAYKYHTFDNPINTGSDPDRVIRGGSWNNDPTKIRTSKRSHYPLDRGDTDIGFRLAAPK